MTNEEQRALEALDFIQEELARLEPPQVARDVGEAAVSLCESYQRVKEKIDPILTVVGMLPFFGSKVVDTIRLLMKVADGVCEKITA